MNDDVSVRRYESRDRAAVREICCDTADAGEPVERFFSDREVFADLLTRYYTDYSPETLWVAEQGGQVVGYLMGCFETRRFVRTTVFRIAPRAFLRAIGRGTLFQAQTWRLLKANLHSQHTDFNRNQVIPEYPAHLHINLRRGGRSQGIGPVLMERFLGQAHQAAIPGVHAGVSDVNAPARRFFEKQGFVALGREARFRKSDQADEPSFTIIYGKRLKSGKLS